MDVKCWFEFCVEINNDAVSFRVPLLCLILLPLPGDCSPESVSFFIPLPVLIHPQAVCCLVFAS